MHLEGFSQSLDCPEASVTRHVLIADDEPLIRQTLSDYLADCGYQVTDVGDGEEVLRAARAAAFQAVLLDLRMPKVHGLDVIALLAREQPNLPVVVVSGTGVLHDAVEAMRRGAWDYISKPITDMDEVAVVLDRVLDRARLIAERDHYQRELARLNGQLEAEIWRQTEDLRSQNRRLTAMNRVAHAVSHALELDTMLERALDAVLSAVQAEAGIIQLLNPATNCLYVTTARGFADEQIPYGQPLSLGDGVAGRVVQQGHVRMGRLKPDDLCVPGLDLGAYASYALVPLYASDDTVYWEHEQSRQVIVGLLGIFATSEDAFVPDEIELLTTVGNQLGVAVTRAQYAADLRRANLQLETANEELKRLDRLREQFIQNVAHELRTPLALVRGYVELLAEEDLTPDRWGRAVSVARKRVLELVELVEAITTLQDLDTEPLTIKPVGLSELIATACQMTQQRAISSGIRFKCRDLEIIESIPGDFSRLAQALHQILDNACKFSDAGKTVTISGDLSADERYVMISIEDQGIGIPQGEQIRIFERFYQIDGSATRRYGGTGLGLALARETVEAHGGWIRVESEVGVGSTFSLGLPRTSVPAHMSA